MRDVESAAWPLRCAFCMIDEHEAGDDGILVQGPFVCICADCIETCAEVVRERRASGERLAGGEGEGRDAG